MKQFHHIQLSILNRLLLSERLRYMELKPDEKMDNNQFDFHLDKMIAIGYITKHESHYTLTAPGKEYANRLDTETVLIEKQAKIGVVVVCERTRSGITEYLVHQRLKHPYYGYHGFITGKVRMGDTIEETALRELDEEAGISAELTLVRIVHKMDYATNGEILEDKFFYVFRGNNPTGTMKNEIDEGKNFWSTLDEIKKLPKLFPDLIEGIERIHDTKMTFTERKYVVEEF